MRPPGHPALAPERPVHGGFTPRCIGFTAAVLPGTAVHAGSWILLAATSDSPEARSGTWTGSSRRRARRNEAVGRERTEVERKMPVLVARMEVLEEFAEWAGGSDSPFEEKVIRGALMARMLGESYEENERLRRAGGERPTVRPGELRWSEPLAGKLATRIEEQVRLRHAPACLTWTADDGEEETVFVLPRWLNEDPEGDGSDAGLFAPIPRNLHVRFRGDAFHVGDALTESELDEDELRAIRLVRKVPDASRRWSMVSTALTMLDELEVILGMPLSEDEWLLHLVEAPAAAEEEALHLWNDVFLPGCGVPPSFLLGDRALSLADMQVLRRGAEGGRHRRTFASQHPWATRIILDLPDPAAVEAAFEPIDANPSASILVAAKRICCSAESACPKAVRFAKFLPRHWDNPALDDLLGEAGTGHPGSQVRSVLLEAHEEDGELLSHIGEDAWETRGRILRAIEVLFAYRDDLGGSFVCAYRLATCLARIFVRSAHDPSDVDPEEIAAGLAALSADSLAAFVAKKLESRPSGLPEADVDTLDAGVLAFLAHVGETRRPRLTARQLLKFAEFARDRSVHQMTVIRTEIEDTWPPPPGWLAEEHASLRGAKVTPLNSVGGCLSEGEELDHCMRHGRYQRAAVMGRVALFSIMAGDGRSTLALKPVERERGGAARLTGWRIEEHRAARNDDPSPGCEAAATALLEALNGKCPRPVPRAEVRRRKRVQEAFDRSRSFNPDTSAAEERWSELYAKRLPRAFRAVTPERIVEDYFRNAVERDVE